MNIGELKKLIKDIPDDTIVSGLHSVFFFNKDVSKGVALDIDADKLTFKSELTNRVVVYVLSFSDFIASNIDELLSKEKNLETLRTKIVFDIKDPETKYAYERLLENALDKILKDRFSIKSYPDSITSKKRIVLENQE